MNFAAQPPFSPQSQGVVARAKQLAGEEGSGVAGEAHLLLSVLETSDADDVLLSPLLARSGITREEARLYAQSATEITRTVGTKAPQLSKGARKILYNAAIQARFSFDSTPQIEPHHIFMACVDSRHRRRSSVAKVLVSLGFDAPQLHRDLHELREQKLKNPLHNFSPRAKIAVEAAHDAMRASFCGRISAAHLLLGLLSDGEIAEVLQKAGCDLEDLRKRARESIRSDGEIATPQKRFSPGAKRALERAAREAKLAGNKFIDCGDLLLGLLPQKETIGEKWRARGRNLDSVEGLWTAAQVAAMQLALRMAPAGPLEVPEYPRQKRFAASQILHFFPLFLGLCWGALLSTPAPSRGSPIQMAVVLIGLSVLLISGLGTCVTMMLNRSERAKQMWLNVFGGWILGAIIAAILSAHL